MALSDIERSKRYEVIHTLNKLFDTVIGEDASGSNESAIIDEASDTRIKDLGTLEKFLEGKSLPYMGVDSAPTTGEQVDISILFMSTKNVQVDPNKNFLNFGFSIPSEEDGWRYNSISVGYDYSCSLESFIGLPKKVESSDVKSISDITKECNPNEIYNMYKQDALDMIRYRMPAAYSMFTGGNLIRQIDSAPGTTLYVYYDKRFNKFHFAYNPVFILECALDEWYLNRRSYDTLKDCYCYVLAFLITHEMMHLIHHNTTSTIDMGDVGGHNIVNQVQDSFINCQISRVFNGLRGTRSLEYTAPMPRLGMGSSITVRAEHNRGFKKYASVSELAKSVIDVVTKTIKMSSPSSVSTSRDRDLSEYEGADIFITVNIGAKTSSLRSNSAIFQKCINDIVKVITDGKVYDKFSKLSDSEKESDKPILSEGTLVQVKGSKTICSVSGYNKETEEYSLDEMEMSDVTKTDMGKGQTLNTPVYTKTGRDFGKRRRREIRPFDPNDASWIEEDKEREKKTKLSDEELQSLNTPTKNIIEKLIDNIGKESTIELIKVCIDNTGLSSIKPPADELVESCLGVSEDECRDILGEIIYEALSKLMDSASSSGNGETPQQPEAENHPVFHVGDIVWVTRLKKFGKIVSINNGMFELEEMEEVGVRVLDDSDYHKEEV